ncbi:hypothetical protein RRG08_012865 [Elysia crispata]|uniref:Uncharacterized protein n=1 Tax=Elysia crispata TaxID=231223 RepID=A0AAE0Y7N7_9GAST|nr:hypothetical protein RRG08_012865 [Elysia crispata]
MDAGSQCDTKIARPREAEGRKPDSRTQAASVEGEGTSRGGKKGLLSFLTRLVVEAKRLYPDPMKKLILSGAACQISFYAKDLCSAISQSVHCP